jgi:hypothetical protein
VGVAPLEFRTAIQRIREDAKAYPLWFISRGLTTSNIKEAKMAEDHTIEGKVTFVGTMSEFHSPELGYNARFRVRVHGSCKPPTGSPIVSDVGDHWLIIRSGRMDGAYAHNSANLINAYDTLLTAFTTKKTIRIDGLSRCHSLLADEWNLWDLQIGISQ